MKINSANFFFMLFIPLVLSSKAEAITDLAPFKCPERIAVLANDDFSIRGGKILEEVYAQIGCKIQLVPLPGLRGIQAFNKKQVDGDALRLPATQQYYTRPYVKSAAPLLKTVTALWMHPSPFPPNRHSVGYVRGIAWQAEYLRQEKLWGTDKAIAFNSIKKMIEAYERGSITMFLSEETVIDNNIQNGHLQQKPLLTKAYGSMPFHHYLGAEYKDAMERLSKTLSKNNPFTDLE